MCGSGSGGQGLTSLKKEGSDGVDRQVAVDEGLDRKAPRLQDVREEERQDEAEEPAPAVAGRVSEEEAQSAPDPEEEERGQGQDGGHE